MNSPRPRLSLRRFARRLVFVLAAFTTLVTLIYAVENWRGRRAWERYKAELISRGERLALSDYAAAPVPSDQNFAETPILRALAYKNRLDTNAWAKFQSIRGVQSFIPMGTEPVRKQNAEEILNAFKEVEPELAELRAATQRPFARFTNSHANVFLADIPNFVVLRTLSQLFTIHATAELALGRSDRAWADLQVVHRLADSLAGHSTLVEAMIRVALLGLTVPPFQQGLSTGAWSDVELMAWQKHFESVELLAGYDAALRGGERNGVTRLVDELPRQELADMLAGKDARSLKDYAFKWAIQWCPRGWLYQNAVNYSRLMQASFETYDVRAQRVFPEKCSAASTFIEEQLQVMTPFKYLAIVGLPNLTKATQATAQSQTTQREAAVACALERYRRAHGEFPEALAALVPQFLAKLPSDLMTGDGWKYQRRDKDSFVLYSVGWDLRDDGGLISTNRVAGDWVWAPAP